MFLRWFGPVFSVVYGEVRVGKRGYAQMVFKLSHSSPTVDLRFSPGLRSRLRSLYSGVFHYSGQCHSGVFEHVVYIVYHAID